MIASGASNSPTGRWKGRLHREHASPEFYISKRTFDTLRATSEDSLEEIVYEALVGVLKPNLDGKVTIPEPGTLQFSGLRARTHSN